MRQLMSSGSPFEAAFGYSRAVCDGGWIFVSGITGFDYATMTISSGVSQQAEQALRNIDAVLREAGATLVDVVRVLYVLPMMADFEACGPALRAAFGKTRPAAMVMAAGLLDPRMKIEIEAAAKRS